MPDPDEELTFFNPWADIAMSRNNLPHWQQRGATYFITFRMADAIPAALQGELEEEKTGWLKHHPKPWDEDTTAEYRGRFLGEIEHCLDAGHGSCFLARADAREVVSGALRYFDGNRYVLHSATVMPNHVHCVVTLHDDYQLAEILHSWKSCSAHKLITLFSSDAPRPFWREDYFDRMVRDRRHFENCVRYIRRNPEKAGLRKGGFDLYESDLALGVQ